MTSISEPTRRVACIECRRMKTRCTGGAACARCLRLLRPCFYEVIEHKSKGARLEDKLQKLETEIQILESRRTGALSHQPVTQLGQNNEQAAPSMAPIQHSLPIYPERRLDASNAGPGMVSQSDFNAGYGSVIPRTIVETSLYQWDTKSEISSELKGFLVRIFLPFRSHYLFYVDPSKFLQRIFLDPSHPCSIHPALLNVIYLVACSIGGGSWSHLEPIFLLRTRAYLEQSLALADRLTHFMWASVILGTYYGLADRQLEAFNTMSASINFAVGFGLHRNHREPGQESSLRVAAIQNIETDDPMSLWYAVYLTDLNIAGCGGFPSSVPEQSATSFGVLFSDQLQGSLHSGELSLRVRIETLYATIRQFKITNQTSGQPPGSLRQRFEYLAAIMDNFLQILPPLTDPRGIHQTEVYSPVNPHMVPIHFCFHASIITLFSMIIEPDNEAFRRVVNAAHAMANLSRALCTFGPVSPVQAYAQIIPFVYCGCEALALEVRRTQGRALQEQIYENLVAKQGLDVLLDLLMDLTRLYPAWSRRVDGLCTLLEGHVSYRMI